MHGEVLVVTKSDLNIDISTVGVHDLLQAIVRIIGEDGHRDGDGVVDDPLHWVLWDGQPGRCHQMDDGSVIVVETLGHSSCDCDAAWA